MGILERNVRLQVWMLVPHCAALAAFIFAFIIIAQTGTNRTDADFYLGMTGYIAAVFALITTVAAFIGHSWRKGRMIEWLLLALHVIGVALIMILGSAWLGAHIA